MEIVAPPRNPHVKFEAVYMNVNDQRRLIIVAASPYVIPVGGSRLGFGFDTRIVFYKFSTFRIYLCIIVILHTFLVCFSKQAIAVFNRDLITGREYANYEGRLGCSREKTYSE